MLALMNAMRTRLLAAALMCGSVAVLTTGCSAVSLESIATECGGGDAGVMVDDSALAVAVDGDTQALVCVLPKVFTEKSDQYAVTMLVDGGAGSSQQIDGRDVTVTEMAGSTVVLITAK